ncbi:hypothetical protein EHS25_007424 [Saitozyma podzolica]|uniref:MFS general substrate transporter n=1 Tax=Saitozyma podzolica TaxID=1890683 RepID=A0A427YPQ7_9TREE|nr:hypothetical protein EHS25_007424 [Saitozyma podzolica]
MSDEIKKPNNDDPAVVSDREAQVVAEDRAGRTWAYRVWTSAWFQIFQTSVIAFCCPGMYNAMSGMGGGGNVDPHISAQSSVALTATGAASYLIVCVPIFEIIGVRAMGLGGWTYALYSGALLNYANNGNGAFVVASGALLGLGSAFFWLVQGAVMIAYPLPHQKGRAIAAFWIIFNLGGCIGGFIAFGQNYGKANSGTISNSTYWAFIAIMIVGAILSCLLAPPWLVVRSDGSRAGHNPKLNKHDESAGNKFLRVAKREALSVLALRHEKRVIFLIPMFFAANWFYSYQQNIMNGTSFDLDGRTLNSALYWAAQMIGGFLIGAVCDFPWLSRPKRALLAWAFVFVFGNAVMGGGLAFENLREAHPADWIVFQSSEYAGPAVLYFFYGMLDALWQGLSYWMLGAMCSTPELGGKLVAVYKVSQSVGAAIAYQLTTDNLSGRKQFISNWCIIAITLVVAFPAVLRITEPTEEEARGGMTEGEKTDMVPEDFKKTAAEGAL